MKTITTLRSAALATFAVAAVSLPTLAQATDYRNGYYNPNAECKAKENDAQLIGGLLGAIAGGVIGSQVSGNGARTEGSAIGVVLGGLAGAGLGDESVECGNRRNRNNTRNYSSRTYGQTRPIVQTRTVTTRRVTQPNRNSGNNNGYQNAGYNNGRYNNGRNNNGQYNQRNHRHDANCNHGYNNDYTRINELQAKLHDVQYELREKRQKNRRLERRVRRDPYNHKLQRRLERVCDDIVRLERRERRLIRKLRNQTRNYY